MASKKSAKAAKPTTGSRSTGSRTTPPREREATRIRWERRNIALFGSGLGAIVIGYGLLSQGDVTAAPLLLVAGYCVLIPLAFIL